MHKICHLNCKYEFEMEDDKLVLKKLKSSNIENGLISNTKNILNYIWNINEWTDDIGNLNE